jgi:FAD:protein FMN transferase
MQMRMLLTCYRIANVPGLRHSGKWQIPMHSESRIRLAMGTWVAIEAQHGRGPALPPAIEAAYAAVLEVDRLMHPHRPGSDLARVNQAPLHVPVEVHSLTWEVLRLARELSEISEGIFDPCLPTRPGRMSDVELTESGHAICHAPVSIDLGGIAKGYAVDRAVAALSAHGCSSGLVNAGGDLRVFGPESRTILLRSPDGSFNAVELWNESLAASSVEAPERPAEHQGYYDRRTSRAPRCVSAAVIAKDAAVADALVKCVLVGDALWTTRVLKSCEARLPYTSRPDELHPPFHPRAARAAARAARALA